MEETRPFRKIKKEKKDDHNIKNDEKTSEEKAIDDWLPITPARSATWYHSAFHNVTTMVGAAVLSLPYAFSELGWGPAIAIFVLSWIITLYTLWHMVEMHEIIPGKRLDRYHDLGQVAFGEKLGLWIVVPQQLTLEFASEPEFHRWGFLSCCFHVLELLNGCLDSFA